MDSKKKTEKNCPFQQFFIPLSHRMASPSGMACEHIEKDVNWRLSCRNINFAKVTTVTDRAMKRLRSKRRVVTPARGEAIGAAFMVHQCWRGHSLVAYPDG
jgi:hypothetical protein